MPTKKLRSVLFVDDDADVAEVVQATLSLVAGLDVSLAPSGMVAIELAGASQPDLILMDIVMPGLDGPSTFKRLRDSPRTADIPVIFLTAKLMPAELEALLDLGALGVIAKPFDPLKLGDEVAGLWQKADRGNTTSAAAAAELQARVDPLVQRFIDRAKNDVVRMRESIEQARRGDPAALTQVELIAHSIHGTGAMLGLSRVSAAGEAVERLSAEITANMEAHGPIGDSALVSQISACIERLARAVETALLTAPEAGGMFQLRRAGH